MFDQFQYLFLFYRSPRRAAGAVLDHGHFLFGLVAALLVTIALSTGATIAEGVDLARQLPGQQEASRAGQQNDQPETAITPDPMAMARAQQQMMATIERLYFGTSVKALLVMAVVFVPISILILAAWDHLGGGMTILYRDYMPVLTGLLFAWTAAQLPFTVAWWLFALKMSPLAGIGLELLAVLFFAVLGSFVLSTVTGAGIGHALVTGMVSLAVCAVSSLLFAGSSGFLYMFASPWVLYYAYGMFGRDVRSLGGGLSARQNFKHQLELATLNPRDADAHYQLGLLYLQRRSVTEAEARFRQALEINPKEPETLFHLGRLLRQQAGREKESLALLEQAVQLDSRLANYEVWRELGSLALTAGRADVALPQLEHYVSFREFDPEGLVLLGQALRAADRPQDAKAAFEKAILAVKTAPLFRRGVLKRWEGQARQELRQLGV